jgi:DNA-binding CsgD family transcriptional regulator
MRKSGRLRLGDLRRAFRLVHDCRDVGHDHRAWPVVLAEGLARLVDAQVVILGEVGVGAPGVPPHQELLADRGWHSPGVRDFWHERYIVNQEFRLLPTFQRFGALQGGLITRAREQLVDDGEWYGSLEFNEYHRSFVLDDVMFSLAMLGDPPALQGFSVLRELGRERFGAGQRRLIRLFHRELAGHVGNSLAREPGHPLPMLPPRLRQTLRCLLEGDSEKQAALRMRLSAHTVHQYAKALYRRLGVSSRAELMALCHKRSGPTRQATPDPDPPR